MKMNKLAKRIIAGGLGVIMMASLFVGVPIHNMGDVQAKTKVFDQITTKYPSSKDFSILEIIPEIPNNTYYYAGGSNSSSGLGYDANGFTFYFKDDWNTKHKFMISSQSEFGYFLARTPKDTAYSTDAGSKKIRSAAGVTQGGLYGNPIMQTNDTNYQSFLQNMYQYGMIKPDGWDSKGFYNENHSGDYPVFADTAIFSEHYNATTNQTFSESLAKGVYTSVSDNSGNYMLADGYKLNDQHAICKVTVSMNQIGEEPDPAVSGNMIPVYEEVELLEEVEVDNTRMQLPQSPDGTIQYVSYVEGGGGNLVFARSQVATPNREYFGLSDLSVFYTDSASVIYFSSDWFRELVLGDNNPTSGYGNTKIKYETVRAKDVTESQIEEADLIYISGKDILYTKGTNDISEEVLLKLYNEEVLNHKAVMMDYALYNGSKKSSEMTNIAKLALLLWQDGQSTLRTMQNADFAASTNELTDVAFLNRDSGDTVKTLKEGLTKVVGNTNGNFVRGNVYVYNHLTSVFNNPKSKIDALDNFANGDFNTAYTSGVMTEGFGEIITYINAYNKNSMTGGLSTSITPAVAIQYILISDGSTITMMKNSLRVLEIQPVPAYLYNPGRGKTEYIDLDSDNANDAKYIENRKQFVKKYLSNYYSEDINNVENSMLRYIEFTSMTVSEFNGHNEDLVENYDIVYIGDEMARQDTVKYSNKTVENFNYYKTAKKSSRRWDSVTKSYVSEQRDISYFENNTEMNGMIYYGIGEEVGGVSVYSKNKERFFGGFLTGDQDSAEWNKINGQYTVRFSGRDITKNKLKKLKEFLQADGLVLVAEELLGDANNAKVLSLASINPTATTTSATEEDDHGRVDNSSNLYELLAYGLGYSFDTTTRKYVLNANSSDITANAAENTSFTQGFENFVSASYVESHPELREELSKYVSSDKVYITLRKFPTPYEYSLLSGTEVIDPDSITYMDETNGRYLEYEFFISTELGNVSEMYNVNLYVDLNNDGKYSKVTEQVGDFSLVETASGREAVKDAEGNYILYGNGTNYTLKRKLADEYCGFIKWKLEVQSTDPTKAFMHGSQEGYTLVKNITGEDKKVNILQITRTNGSNLNLQKQLYDRDSKWGKYLNNVAGYSVHIKTLTMEQFQNDVKAQFNDYNKNHSTQQLSIEEFALDYYFKDFYVEKTVDDPTRKFQYTKDKWGNQYSYSEDVKGVNMLVLGFGDNFDSFNNDESVRALEAFVESGQPVLMSHDFLSFHFEHRQTREMREYSGMDKYGVTQNIKDDGTLVNIYSDATAAASASNVLHVQTNITTDTEEDKASIELMEKTGKEVAYAPGSGRSTVVPYKQGYSNFIMTWRRRWNKQEPAKEVGQEADPKINRNTFIQSIGQVADLIPRNDEAFRNYDVNKLNDGQITEYPYHIPDTFRTQTTHSQYFELDLTSDADQDDESDVVVWYTLGTAYGNTTSTDKSTGRGQNMYDDIMGCSADPANGYYIYNKNNVTYTGAGHSSLAADDTPEQEIQLFVNCLLASFETGLDKPSTGFYESVSSTARRTSCITIPYDENVTGPTIDASGNVTKPGTSVLVKGVDASGNQTFKYKFVDQYQNANIPDDDKTVAYFRVSDTNLVRGNKSVDVKYYLKVESNMIQMEPGHEHDTEYFGYVELYGQKLPVKRISPTDSVVSNTVDVVDVSGLIATYHVDQKTGAFGSQIGRYTTTAPSESNLNNSVRNLECDSAYGIYLPMFQLNKNASFTLYLESTSVIKKVLSNEGTPVEQRTQPSYKPLTVTKADLMDLD